MKADNDNLGADPFSRLPLFASDAALAAAIVGKDKAAEWRRAVLPTLERRGFPSVDALHKARPVPLVRAFYNGYFGIMAGFANAKPDGEENWESWKKPPRRAA